MILLPIVRPVHPSIDEIAADFGQALDSGQVTNGGPYVRKFEDALSEALGVPTIVFSSGQAALIAMLMAADVAGGEVICPSFTFCATPHAIRMAGAAPVFADISPDALCLDSQNVLRRITPRTKAILGVDPYGIRWMPPPGEYTTDLPILIDAAPSFGSRGQKRNCAAFIHSFHATKPFSTMEGGCLSSNDPDLLERATRIRNFGQDDDGDCSIVGFNGKMTEISAIIGLKQLETYDAQVQSRVESVSRLRGALEDIRGLRVQRAPLGQTPVWTYLPCFIESEFGKSRDEVAAGLVERGVMVRKYYTACHQMSVFEGRRHLGIGTITPRYTHNYMADGGVEEIDHTLPVTECLASQVISLPAYPMTDDEIEHVANAFKEIQG